MIELKRPIPKIGYKAMLPLLKTETSNKAMFTPAKITKVRAGADLPITKAIMFKTINIMKKLVCAKVKSTILNTNRYTAAAVKII